MMSHAIGVVAMLVLGVVLGRSVVSKETKEEDGQKSQPTTETRDSVVSEGIEREDTEQLFLHDLRKAREWRNRSRGVDIAKLLLEDLSTVGERIEAIENPVLKGEVCRAVGYDWPSKAFEAGVAWAMSLPVGHFRDMAVDGLLARFHDYADMGSDRWDEETVARLIDGLSPQKRHNTISGLASSLAAADPMSALLYLAEYEDEIEPLLFKTGIWGLAARMLRGAEKLPDLKVLESWSSRSMQLAVASCVCYVQAPVEESLSWVASLSEEDFRVSAAYRMGYFRGQDESDPKTLGIQLETWANQQGSTHVRDATLAGLMLSDVDPKDSLRRAALIGDPKVREFGLNRALSRWTVLAMRASEYPLNDEKAARKQMAEAQAALKSLALPDELIRSLDEKYFADTP